MMYYAPCRDVQSGMRWNRVMVWLLLVMAVSSCVVDPAPELDDKVPTGSDGESSVQADNEGCLAHEHYEASTDSCVVNLVCETEDECDAALASLYAEYPDVELEYVFMESEDCLPGEAYDAEEGACYLECETDADCAELAEQVYDGLDVYFDEGFDAGSEHRSPTELEPSLAVYRLDNTLDLEQLSVQDNADAALTDEARHREIWAFVRNILPPNILRAEAAQFHIFTDGPEDTLAYVAPLPDDPQRWFFAIDIEDAGVNGPLGGDIGLGEFLHTVVHEFAHILTLENDQVPPDTSLTEAVQESGEASSVELACSTFYTGEGCSKSASYLNLFFQRFWADIYDEFNEVTQYAETEDEQAASLEAFYERYEDRFVSDYAASNPGEDIAESFTAFVLKERPEGRSIADQKVRFFYQFDNLVQLRRYMRGQIARYAAGA